MLKCKLITTYEIQKKICYPQRMCNQSNIYLGGIYMHHSLALPMILGNINYKHHFLIKLYLLYLLIVKNTN